MPYMPKSAVEINPIKKDRGSPKYMPKSAREVTGLATKKGVPEFGREFVKAVAKPGVNFIRDRAGDVVTGAAVAGELGQRLTVDPQNENKFFDRLAETGSKIMTPDYAKAVFDTSPGSSGDVMRIAAKSGAGATSYLVPNPSSLPAAVGSGFASAALGDIGSQEGTDVDWQRAGTSGLVGGFTGGTLYGMGKGLGAAKNAVFSRAGKAKKNILQKGAKLLGVSKDDAAMGINKATPSKWTKIMSEKGLDINDVTQKYSVPGFGYEDYMGDVKSRGKGGLIGRLINKAEGRLQKAARSIGDEQIPLRDFYEEIINEAQRLDDLAGNDNYVNALDDWLSDAYAKYGNELPVKKALDLKRSIDSDFGAKVTDEGTGRIAAQAQKRLGNYLRGVLKDTYPEIADALDTQTELYTLRDILKTAWGTSRTRGSEIRKGSFDSLIDLINPIKIRDAAYSNPRVAGTIIGNTQYGGKQPAPPDLSIPQVIQDTFRNSLTQGVANTFSRGNNKKKIEYKF